jgi:hypothetical protein
VANATYRLFGLSAPQGRVRIPLAFRLWHKGGPSKFTLALEVPGYARNRLRCKPQFVLFDSWYPSKPLLKRLRDPQPLSKPPVPRPCTHPALPGQAAQTMYIGAKILPDR